VFHRVVLAIMRSQGEDLDEEEKESVSYCVHLYSRRGSIVVFSRQERGRDSVDSQIMFQTQSCSDGMIGSLSHKVVVAWMW